jgi:branched-chain amino acid transport system permease protein
LMVSIGGSGHFFGPVLGALFYGVLQDWLSSLTKYWMLIMGCVFVFVIMYMRGGIVSLFRVKALRKWIQKGRRNGRDIEDR